ncbi:MAG: hypothetical protein HDS53_02555 [Barnesiella sp.]|nr:hypothetical protein [Barnesiella sp.]
MKHTDILKEKAGSNGGMTVPEGFFESFNRTMAEKLPEQPWEKGETNILPRTRWQKIRPYVYLAAMFMGVWCMMKMFDMMKPNSLADPSLESNTVLMSALDNDAYYYDIITQEVSDGDIYDELYNEGFDPETISDNLP